MPFYQNSKQIVEAQEKLSTIQKKYDMAKIQISKLNESNSKYFAEL